MRCKHMLKCTRKSNVQIVSTVTARKWSSAICLKFTGSSNVQIVVTVAITMMRYRPILLKFTGIPSNSNVQNLQLGVSRNSNVQKFQLGVPKNSNVQKLLLGVPRNSNVQKFQLRVPKNSNVQIVATVTIVRK